MTYHNLFKISDTLYDSVCELLKADGHDIRYFSEEYITNICKNVLAYLEWNDNIYKAYREYMH